MDKIIYSIQRELTSCEQCYKQKMWISIKMKNKSYKEAVKKSDLKKLKKDILREDRKEDNKLYEKKHKRKK